MFMTVDGEKMAFLMAHLVHVNYSDFTRLSKNTNSNLSNLSIFLKNIVGH